MSHSKWRKFCGNTAGSRRKTGMGSQNAIRRHLDALTSPEGPFMIVQNEAKVRVIVKREGN